MENIPSNWFMEFVTPDTIQQFAIKDLIYTGRSEYQKVEMIDTTAYGKCLVLDNKIQSCESDEFIYHEALVQPAMTVHPKPETVFIAGGGEGATLREVLRHNTVKRVVMVDIDKEVIDLCKKYLPDHSQGAFDDPRVELLHTDAKKYLEETKTKFDVIIIDLPEPVKGGPAFLLYTRNFYEMLKTRMAEGATFALQSGATILGITEIYLAINNTLRTAFDVSIPYEATVPSFGGPWGFTINSMALDPRQIDPAEIDRRLEIRLSGKLRFYDGHTHQGLFYIPKYLRDMLDKETTIITEDNPVFIPGF